MAKKVIVIGSGFGGLASALRLKSKGYEVSLFEKHSDLGGRARVFRKGNFIFDAGPTVITAPHLLGELFELFGKDIKKYVHITPLKLWYRFIFSDGSKFDYSGDEKTMEKEIGKISSKDIDGYKKLLAFTSKIFNKEGICFDMKMKLLKGTEASSVKPLSKIFEVKANNFL